MAVRRLDWEWQLMQIDFFHWSTKKCVCGSIWWASEIRCKHKQPNLTWRTCKQTNHLHRQTLCTIHDEVTFFEIETNVIKFMGRAVVSVCICWRFVCALCATCVNSLEMCHWMWQLHWVLNCTHFVEAVGDSFARSRRFQMNNEWSCVCKRPKRKIAFSSPDAAARTRHFSGFFMSCIVNQCAVFFFSFAIFATGVFVCEDARFFLKKHGTKIHFTFVHGGAVVKEKRSFRNWPYFCTAKRPIVLSVSSVWSSTMNSLCSQRLVFC